MCKLPIVCTQGRQENLWAQGQKETLQIMILKLSPPRCGISKESVQQKWIDELWFRKQLSSCLFVWTLNYNSWASGCRPAVPSMGLFIHMGSKCWNLIVHALSKTFKCLSISNCQLRHLLAVQINIIYKIMKRKFEQWWSAEEWPLILYHWPQKWLRHNYVDEN